MERLDKFIANQGQLSRKDARTAVWKGEVTVNGEVQKLADAKISPESDEICISGVPVSYRKFLYIMLNKPQGVVCSTKDGVSPTVLSLLPPELYREGLFPAGRLDKDTEGFVLLTDDGLLAHRMLAPKSHVEKLYYCRLARPCEEGYAEAFIIGIEFLTGEKCLPAGFLQGENDCEAFVTLHEGMFHQVKRMFETLGNEVVYLKRLRIGQLTLDEDLELGECKEILHKDVEKLLA